MEELNFEDTEVDLVYILFCSEEDKQNFITTEKYFFKSDLYYILECDNFATSQKEFLAKEYQKIDSTNLEIMRPVFLLTKNEQDFSNKNLPQEAGFTKLISWTKGCFVGQEGIARLQHKGKIVRLLAQIRTNKPLNIEDKITNKKQNLGRITSICNLPYQNNFYSLGYIKTSWLWQEQQSQLYSTNGVPILELSPIDKFLDKQIQ